MKTFPDITAVKFSHKIIPALSVLFFFEAFTFNLVTFPCVTSVSGALNVSFAPC